MINSKLLLSDLRKLLKTLELDLRERCENEKEINAPVRTEYEAAKKAGRTVAPFETWREEYLTQVAVAWILGCVFVRFLEDNRLVDSPMLSGPGARMSEAAENRDAYFGRNPLHSDRDYIVETFRKIEKLPAGAQLFDERHNPLWRVPISGDAARSLLDLWRRVDPASGVLVHDFTDPEWTTRFLGDLYQDLSEEARDKYALLQTPLFVEEFILDRTLDPAIDEFGYSEVRLIDPACGSGHFLLGAFARLLKLRMRHEPHINARALVQRVLDQIYGVDLNPFAVAIARFRMLLAALHAADETRLADAPDFKIKVATGDSLIHGRRFTGAYTLQQPLPNSPERHLYEAEDGPPLEQILGQQYHAVVGNPPYITVKDRALNEIYRRRFGSCHRKYQLVAPFMERFFDLAIEGDARKPAGYVGMIVSNAFMKREFGKKLIEKFISNWDLTVIVDNAGTYIPGHGTPTALIFGRNRKPMLSTLRAVMGIRGEPSTPDEPADGKVWTEIVAHIDQPGFSGEFVSVADCTREVFNHHPWSLGGGGAADLKSLLDERGQTILGDLVVSVGPGVILGEDEAFGAPSYSNRIRALPGALKRPLVEGQSVRDWSLVSLTSVLFPYNDKIELLAHETILRWLWAFRAVLEARKDFSNKTYRECGRPYWEYHQIPVDRNRTSLSIVLANVATHNHFVFDRGGKVFNRHSPLIKLHPEATESDHLELLGLLNSSTACFWMKQTLMDRGNGGIGGGIASEKWERFYEHDGTKLQKFPVTSEKPLSLARRLDSLAQKLTELTPAEIARGQVGARGRYAKAHAEYQATRQKMIAVQEELDWECYRLYGIVDEPLTMPDCDAPEINLGERAFEIVMARRMATGELETTWFERHGSTPITEIPAHWPLAYRKLVERRIGAIQADSNVALIEKPEYKRRWNTEPWGEQLKRALRGWLLDRLEDPRYWPELALTSCVELTHRAAADTEFMQVAELYRGTAGFDVLALVEELAGSESVPYLPRLRYKESGMRKRVLWEQTWSLQRDEDEIVARTRLPPTDPNYLKSDDAAALKRKQIGEIPVPPKYKSADFIRGDYWRLRGALDVPKERFVSYPGCERRTDDSLVISWAGWNYLQQAQALAAFYVSARDEQGWSNEKLAPLLDGLLELLPWLKQWHNEIDPEYNQRMSDFFETFIDQELHRLGLTREAGEIRGVNPQ